MEKVSFWLAWNYQLGWSGFEIFFVKIDCEYHQIYALRIIGVKVCGE